MKILLLEFLIESRFQGENVLILLILVFMLSIQPATR